VEVLRSNADTRSDACRANREAFLEEIERVGALQAQACEGGGEKYVQRHRERGKLLARERIELLLDRDAPFLGPPGAPSLRSVRA
jgi:acetyl-CoA carboxylase carboxyltransferase component